MQQCAHFCFCMLVFIASDSSTLICTALYIFHATCILLSASMYYYVAVAMNIIIIMFIKVTHSLTHTLCHNVRALGNVQSITKYKFKVIACILA